MKTTLELPDELFAEAKAVAARRRTTLKALVTHALKREIYAETPAAGAAEFVLDVDGFPCLPSRGASVTSAVVHRFQDDEDAR